MGSTVLTSSVNAELPTSYKIQAISFLLFGFACRALAARASLMIYSPVYS